MANGKQCYCKTCNKTMVEEQFYTSNNIEKYPPEGKMPQCKKCLTMHVDNFDPETYLWILQEIDVPYIPDEWNKLMMTYAKDRTKLTGTTILGRYLAKMKLKQWKEFRWKDTEHLKEMAALKLEQTMKQQGYDAVEIAVAVDRQNFTIPQGELIPPPPPPQNSFPEAEDYFGNMEMDSGFDDDLTEEDRTYLRLKWGKTYKPEEWIKLEQLYEEMMSSYDIQAAGDLNTLKLACKCSLKANQLIDIGDIDGAQKATKMYDSLMKSGKWTAQQNKEDGNDLIDSIGELVAMCERDGFIPKYYTAGPQDHADRVIEDLKRYTHDLIQNESGLSNMFEIALKQIDEENERIKEAAENAEDEEDKLFDYDNDVMMETKDFTEFSEFEEQLEEENEAMFEAFLNGDDV